jgi:hypothetical protein
MEAQMISTRSTTLALATLASLFVAQSALAESDHQQCYKIKDSAEATAYTANLAPTDGAFPLAVGCEIKARAKLLCIDVEKSNVNPSPPGADDGLPAQKSLCYKVKCPTPASSITATLTDQFGVHVVEAKKSFLLCAPVPPVIVGECTLDGDCSPLANAQVVCVANSCDIGACNAGYGNCDGMEGTGCESDLMSDPNSCNSCGLACPDQANASPTCTSGTCGFACDVGYGDCDGMPGSGCESNLMSDPNSCNSCGLACPDQANSSPTCTSGTCGIACDVGYADCDGMPGTGCETNTQSDPFNCGGCGLACPFGTPNCVAGGCFP